VGFYNLKILTGFIFVLATPISIAYAQEPKVVKPITSSVLYTQLLEAIRPRVEFELKTKVKFKVNKMNVAGNWAYLEVVPLQMNGHFIDYSKTKFRNVDIDLSDPQDKALLTNYALLKKTGSRWYEIRQESFQIRANINWGEYFSVKPEVFGYE